MIEELYKNYYQQLLKWCIKKTNNYIDAEDLVQEIYYQLVKTYTKDIIIVDQERFIWKLAHYTWCNRVKKYVKENKIGNLDLIENNIKDENIDISKQIELEEMKEILSKHIIKLNDITKKCVQLYYYENLSIKEISSKLEISDSLVKYYLFQARKKLRSELENEIK